jgi:hypothetical protein
MQSIQEAWNDILGWDNYISRVVNVGLGKITLIQAKGDNPYLD